MSSQLEERTLGVWLHNVPYRQKNKMLSAERMQRLLNSSSSRLTARAVKWLDSHDLHPSFKAWLEELRQFVREHNRMPDNRKHRSRAEQRLMPKMRKFVNPSNCNYEMRLQLLEKEGPIVAGWVKSQRARNIVRVQEAQWNRQFDNLLDFVEVPGRLPQTRLEGPSYDWLCRQQRLLNYLPAELRAKLLDSRPAIAAFLQS